MRKRAEMLLTPMPDEPVEHWLLRGLYVRLLRALHGQSYYSRDLSLDTGIPQPVIKPMLRELRLYGLVQFQKGNLNEDGETYGSGHFITKDGRDYLHKMREEYNDNPSRTAKS